MRKAPMHHSIRDNKKRGSVGSFLQEHITCNAKLSFVSAYFTTHAYYGLKEKLDMIAHLRFLFGEPSFMTENIEGKQAKAHVLDPQTLTLSKTISQKKVAKECHDWLDTKCEVRSMVKPNFLHGKAYHIHQENGFQQAIVGSSNFTVNGLGFGKSPNIELNLKLNDQRDTSELVVWFDEIWNDEKLSVDVKQELLAYLNELYKDNAPSFVYFFTLYHLFNKDIAFDDEHFFDIKTHILETQIWKMLFEFQKDGAKEAIKKVQKYGGAFLCDSVGLGKTFTALATIKYFELKNHRVLVLAPKRLEQNWKIYKENSANNPLIQDRFAFDLYAHTDLDREKFEHIYWGNYDLVVIDESHNFKNHSSSRYAFLMESIIQKGANTKVLLLSATPVNNSFKDLRNQMALIASGEDDAFESFGIGSLENAFTTAQKRLNEWIKEKHRSKSTLISKLGNELFSVLDAMSIARSRKHIHQFYDTTLTFPKRTKPRSIYAPFCNDEHFLSFAQIKERVDSYKLYIFTPSEYVLDAYRHLYNIKPKEENLFDNQLSREYYLVGMMRVNFLKRLESSIHSFRTTLERTIAKIDKAVLKIESFDGDNEHFNVPIDEDEDSFEFSKISYKLSHLRLEDYKKDLLSDKKALQELLHVAECVSIEKDAKLQELKKLILEKAHKPNKKMLIFTAFADTAVYMYDALVEFAQTLGFEVALLTGGGRNDATVGTKQFEAILSAFSPRSKKTTPPKEIDILIATDCVSEGQNLQDCDLLVNYDIHWNPVRIIQRFGRIDRIGSQNDVIGMVNFWPTRELDEYLDLKDRVQTRMLLADIAATGSDNPLESDEASEALIDWRAQQIREIKEGDFDFDTQDDQSIGLADFSFDDIRAELKRYLGENEKQFEETPNGIYAVVENDTKRGAIFCLKAKEEKGKNNQNPLYPYFIVFISPEGEVYYGYKSVKESLKLLQSLCSGIDEPLVSLCEAFDRQTKEGEAMEHYDVLIKKAVESISSTGLHSGRGGIIISESTFELISWFVLRGGVDV